MAGMLSLAGPLLGAVSSGAGLLGGSPAQNVQRPPMFNMPYMNDAATGALGGINSLSLFQNMPLNLLGQYQQYVQDILSNPGANTLPGDAGYARNLGLDAAGTAAQSGDAARSIGTGTGGAIGGIGQQAGQAFSNLGQGAGAQIGGIGTGAGQAFSNLGQGAGAQIGGIGTGAGGAYSDLGRWAGQMLGGIGANAGADYANIGRSGGDFLSSIGRGVLPQANALFNAGSDPQHALYDRTLQQVTDQSRAGQAARGINMSPYGAGLENDATRNFNIDWQNNQLQRMLQGAQGGGNLLGLGGNLIGAGNNMGMQGVQGGANLAMGGIGQGAGLGMQGVQGGSNLATNAIGQGAGLGMGGIQGGANLAMGGLGQGAGLGMGGIQGGANLAMGGLGQGADLSLRGLSTGAGLSAGAPGLAMQAGMYPYSVFNQIGGDRLNAVNSLSGFGQQVTNMPQQQIQDYLQYIGAGNQAGGVANQNFTGGLNQANMMFGQNQIMGQQLGQSLAGLGRAWGGGGGGMSAALGSGGNTTNMAWQNPSSLGWFG